jgi:hypothetical protein
MKKLFVISLLLLCCTSTFSQSGYLGSLNSVSFDLKIGPSIKRTNTLNSSNTIAKKRLRYANLTYNISYNRVFSKRLELKVGYNYSSMALYTDPNTFRTTDTILNINGIYLGEVNKSLNWLKDPRVSLHAANLEFRLYRQGSLAPTGKYYGLGAQIGNAKVNQSYEHLVGKRDVASKDNAFVSKHPIIEVQNLTFDNTVTSSFFYIYGMIGRNYPLTKSLMLNVSTSFPLLIMFFSPTGIDYGFSVDETGIGYFSDDTIDEVLNLTIKKYRRVNFEIGVKYNF